MLETLFTKKDIEDIYNNLIIYSIMNYHNLPIESQNFLKKKYLHALKYLKEKELTEELEYTNYEQLQQTLLQYQVVYNEIYNRNKNTINLYGKKIEKLIIDKTNTYKTPLEKISFLFDFVTNYITYSEDYVNYCLNIPPVNNNNLKTNLEFDFKNQVPVDTTIEGMLVIGQGLCEDISNLLAYLGKKVGLNIDIIFTNYKGTSHSLNKITLDDGKTYLLDATRLIRGDMTKKQCFLVSNKTLNKNGIYQFKQIDSIKDKEENNYNTEEDAKKLIEKINAIKPESYDLNTKRTL